MMQIIPNSNGEDNRPALAWFREMNHCHGKGQGHPCSGGGDSQKSWVGSESSPGARAAARGQIGRVDASTFKEGIGALRRRQRANVSDYSTEELSSMQLFMVKAYKAGYAIKGGDELVNVFNAGGFEAHGAGDWLVIHAIEHGARRLDCFDNGLQQYYEKFGFKKVREEANWTPGEPSVIFMEWHGGNPTTVRARFRQNRRIDAE